MRTSIALEEAQTLLMQAAGNVLESRVELLDAVGRVLSQDIVAPMNLPSFDKSPLDGYALRAADVAEAREDHPIALDVIEELAAGYAAKNKVVQGTAIKIMTGAPIPEGADIVIRFEDVKREGKIAFFTTPLRSGSNVIRAGEDLQKGRCVAATGALIVPALVGLFAALGYTSVPVFDKLKVAVASTGDELLDPSQSLSPGKIYNSNLYNLAAFCTQLGIHPLIFGNVPDRPEAVAQTIAKGLRDADLVITTGGVSVGDFDAVPDALELLGAEVLFRGVDMKPGSPVMAAVKDGKIIVCLSGNPAAAMITFELIVVPLLKKLMGLTVCFPTKVRTVFADDFVKPSPQRRFLRGKLHLGMEANYVTLTGGQSNGVLQSMIDCNVLVDIPAGSGRIQRGQPVTALIVSLLTANNI